MKLHSLHRPSWPSQSVWWKVRWPSLAFISLHGLHRFHGSVAHKPAKEIVIAEIVENVIDCRAFTVFMDFISFIGLHCLLLGHPCLPCLHRLHGLPSLLQEALDKSAIA